MGIKITIPEGDFAGYIFDCDGTLVDSMPLHHEAWKHGVRSAGADWDFPEELFYSWAGRPLKAVIELLNERFDWSLDPEQVASVKETYYRSHLSRVQAIPEVVEHLDNAIAQNLPVSVASGSHRDCVIGVLKATGLLERIPIVVTACDVENGKPAPDIFLEAARRMKIPPERCLVFEDGMPGLEAAKVAGMSSVFIPSRVPA